MGNKSGRIVYKGDDGKWRQKDNDASRAGSTHRTQAQAEAEARRLLKQEGGGELTTKGEDGKIRSKDTIAPGRDPHPPRDREH